MRRIKFLCCLLACSFAVASGPSNALDFLKLPDGFEASVVSKNLPGARQMALGRNGTLFVGTRTQFVYAVDTNQKKPVVLVLQQGLNSPNGVAVHDGVLYVAEIDRIFCFPEIEAQLSKKPFERSSLKKKVLGVAFPRDRHHGWKYIKVGPDGRLFVPVGAPCNICECDPNTYAAIFAVELFGGNEKQLVARGVRNSVGFDWHPITKILYFTDNGRDYMGDELPPDELNAAAAQNLHFGYPYMHGVGVRDPRFGSKAKPEEYTPPVYEFRAHVAPLGMAFYTGKQFPTKYRNHLFVAQHGSWNRSKKIGYRIVVVFLPEEGDANGKAFLEVFASGWLDDESEKVRGRPVDVLPTPEGDLLVSDDHKGAVYRIRYAGKRK